MLRLALISEVDVQIALLVVTPNITQQGIERID